MKNILLTSIIIMFAVSSFSQSRKDTIYIYFKHHKFETKKKYINNSTINYYQIEYKFTLKKSNKYFDFISLSHRNSKGKLIEMPPIEKDKKFLKSIKNKLFTYCDFKNKSTLFINSFYDQNNFKTIYLIDKDENKNGKIYLRKVSFGGNFPRIQ